MIDIHVHALPGMDDGAQDMQEALSMLSIAARSGTEAIVLTPHCNVPGAAPNYADRKLYDRFHAFTAAVRRHSIPISIYLGAEIFCTPQLPDRLSSLLFPTLADSHYPLFEFSFDEEINGMESMLRGVCQYNIVPIIAHPERYSAVQENPEILADWFSRGYVLQLNKDSILGRLGRHAFQTADWALTNGFAHVIASDAHHSDMRTTSLSAVRELVESRYSPEYAAVLFDENPRRILEDRVLVKA